MNKILVAADGSKHSLKAIAYILANRAQFGGAPLQLIHVRPPLPGRAASALGRDTVAKYHADETRKALAATRRGLDKAGLKHSVVQYVGDPGEAIARHAVKGKFSLVVMGSHGHGMLGTMVLGSVVTKVLASCKVPVLIVR
jgi:nucleotide-binding universal stress UspA family protein